uniref:Uncharacterized protein n=1 Tax=Sphaerodactylus townsendi TaxID=933632 RepID=A0ACB8GBW8_9SAUR
MATKRAGAKHKYTQTEEARGGGNNMHTEEDDHGEKEYTWKEESQRKKGWPGAPSCLLGDPWVLFTGSWIFSIKWWKGFKIKAPLVVMKAASYWSVFTLPAFLTYIGGTWLWVPWVPPLGILS